MTGQLSSSVTLEELDMCALMAQFPRRPDEAHKGNFGHVLVIGGNYGMGGAAILAAEAALRVGAGLVSLASRGETISPALARRPEIMAREVASTVDLAPMLARASVVIVGPGLGRDTWAAALLGRVLDTPLPKIIDADALGLLADMTPPIMHQDISIDRILTPHPGEAARLLACAPRQVNEDRTRAVGEVARRFQAVAVLKGAGTLITAPSSGPERVISRCGVGNPGMATGGMGDVLSGIIGGLLAQVPNLRWASELGVCVHAEAGDRAAQRLGQHAMLASDVIAMVPEVLGGLSAQAAQVD